MNESPHDRSPLPGDEDDDEFEEPPRRGFLSGRNLAAAGVVALVLLGGGAALARSGGDGGGTSSGGGGSPQEEAGLEFAACMRDHGVEDFGDPEFEADGGMQFATPDEMRESAGFDAAMEACQPILEAAGPPDAEGQEPLAPEDLADLQDRWLAAAQCVRGEGYDYPDPEVDEFGRVRMVETDDEGFARAIEECLGEAGVGEPPGGEDGSGGEEGS
jgi:hypothetical protein